MLIVPSCYERISPVQLSDSGVYTCVARSQAGLTELSYDVQVQGTIVTLHHFLLFFEIICKKIGIAFILCGYDLQCLQVWIILNRWSLLQSSRAP